MTQKSWFKQALEFIPQVRQEVSRVTWPTRRETVMTAIFVFIFALVAACYFLVVDMFVHRIINWILGLGL